MNRIMHLKWAGVLLLVVVALTLFYSQKTQTLAMEPPVGETALKTLSPSPVLAEKAVPVVADALPASSREVMSNTTSIGLASLSTSNQGMVGLTVSAVGSVKVPADEAYVIMFPEMYYGPSGPEQISSEDRQEVIENLAELGIAESAIEFSSFARYESSRISVELELDEVGALGEEVVETVSDVVRHLEGYGVRYTLSQENCNQALSMARREAIPQVQQAAEDLADGFGLDLGSIAGVLEYPLNSSFNNQVRTSLDACALHGFTPYDDSMFDFGSPQEIEVSVGLQVTYSMQ